MDVSQLEAEDFLEIVWGERPGWVDLPAKVGQYWVPYHLRWPEDLEVTRRIDTCLRDQESLYFSVAQFKRRGREYEDMLSTHWLWADLDEVHPTEAADLGLMPTLAWSSSPGRYQAMWRLHKKLRPETQERINQALSYHLGADQGGWDRTQVLRLPGTRNFKYPSAPPVELLWYEDTLLYSASKVWSIVSASAPKSVRASGESLPRRPLPARARALLRVPADAIVEGERSHRLWELECLLAEAGWGEDEIFAVVADSNWNKWSSVRTGEERLRREIRKAIRHVLSKSPRKSTGLGETVGDDEEADEGGPGEDDEATSGSVEGSESDGQGLPWIRYASFMAVELPEPKWMIQDIWTAGSHGIIGGEPKTSKTGISLAMALSVASGKPFLGKYKVHTPGPVLMVQEENAQWMIQDKMRKLARLYKLIGDKDYTEEKATRGALGKYTVQLDFPTDIPLRLLNNFGLDLSDDDHRELLELAIAEVRPVLIVLDPLYLIFGGIDVDKAAAVYPYLKWLLYLRNEYNTAIAVVHHQGKKPYGVVGNGGRRSGQRLAGSHTLHGWVDSAMYCEAMDEERHGWVATRVETEFRSMAPVRPLEVRLMWGDPGELSMVASVSRFDMTGALLALVIEQPGITANAAAEQLGADKRTVLGRARDCEDIRVEGGKRGRGNSWQLFAETTAPGGEVEDSDDDA